MGISGSVAGIAAWNSRRTWGEGVVRVEVVEEGEEEEGDVGVEEGDEGGEGVRREGGWR